MLLRGLLVSETPIEELIPMTKTTLRKSAEKTDTLPRSISTIDIEIRRIIRLYPGRVPREISNQLYYLIKERARGLRARAVSRESVIDRRQRELTYKMLEGTITKDEQSEYDLLSAERSTLMRRKKKRPKSKGRR